MQLHDVTTDAAQQQVRVAGDRIQRVPQLVAHCREKGRLGAVRFLRDGYAARVVQLAKRRVASLGQVARDLCKADESAFFVAQCGDHDVPPELRSILPNSPAFLLEPAIRGGTFELERWFPPIGLRIKDGEVPADDFVRPITLEALGAGVPAENVPFAVEGEDGVVSHAVDKQSVEASRFIGDAADSQSGARGLIAHRRWLVCHERVGGDRTS